MTEPAFRLLFQADSLGPHPKKLHLSANLDERAWLAQEMGVLEIPSLEAEIMLQRLSGKKIEARFQAKARIIQECVVTFKPLKTEIDISFQRIYVPEAAQDNQKEIEIDLDATDELDPIVDGVIDLCQAVCEELALEIDPFPRSEETGYIDTGFGPEITEEEVSENNPFAVLAQLKKEK